MRRATLLLALSLLAPRAAAQAVEAVAAAPAAAPAGAAPAPVLAAGTGNGARAFAFSAPDRLEFHARGLPVADVFAELRRLVRRNIVVSPEVAATFTGDLYDVTADELVAAICRTAGLVARDQGSWLYVEPDKPETRVYTLHHARASDLLPLVTPLLSPGGQVTGTPASRQGISSSQEEAGGDDYAAEELLIVRDLGSRLAEIDRVVESMDALPRQVLIEATILAVKLTDDLQFGVQFNALAGVDFEEAGALSPGGQSLLLGSFDGEQMGDGLAAAESNVAAGIAKGGLNVGLLGDSVAVFVRALQAITDATVLANPRIVTMNKQRGEVLLGRRDGFLTTTVTQTASTQTVEYLETGTRLIFRPFVSGTDLVRLEIHPEDSNGGLNAEGLPFKETAEVTTNVMVRSGQTVVIGGLFREKEDVTEKKVPLLGDVPLLGHLFRSEDRLKQREEIVIVLTPTIVDASQAQQWERAGLRADELRQQVQELPRPTQESFGPQAAAAPDGPALARAWMEASRSLARTGRGAGAALLARGLRDGEPGVVELRRVLDAAAARDPALAELDGRILAARGLQAPAAGVAVRPAEPLPVATPVTPPPAADGGYAAWWNGGTRGSP